MIATKKLLELNNRINIMDDEVYSLDDMAKYIAFHGLEDKLERQTHFFNLGKKREELGDIKRELEKALIYKSSDFKNIKI